MSRIINSIFSIALIFTVACTSGTESETSQEKEKSIVAMDTVSLGIDTDAKVPQGLQVGSKAPGFAGRDNNGQSFDLYTNLKKGPVILKFYRGKWCPICNSHMSAFNDSVQYILQKGAQIVAITPELPPNSNEFAENTATEYPIISDPTNTIMNAFDVTFKVTDEYVAKIENSKGVNIAENNGNDNSYLPVPATYIIGQNGTIEFVHFDLNYRNRASVKEILEYLK